MSDDPLGHRVRVHCVCMHVSKGWCVNACMYPAKDRVSEGHTVQCFASGRCELFLSTYWILYFAPKIQNSAATQIFLLRSIKDPTYHTNRPSSIKSSAFRLLFTVHCVLIHVFAIMSKAWNCKRCTFLNDGGVEKCSMCFWRPEQDIDRNPQVILDGGSKENPLIDKRRRQGCRTCQNREEGEQSHVSHCTMRWCTETT